MLSTQYLLIILIVSHLATVILIIFDVHKIFPAFLLKFENNKNGASCSNGKLFQKDNNYYSGNSERSEEESISNFQQLSSHRKWQHVISTVRNMWSFLHSRLLSLKEMKIPLPAKRNVNYLDESGVEYYRVLWHEMSQLLDLEEWQLKKRRLAASLAETVQKRIDDLQNPADCKKVKAFLCKLTNPYGFASSIHDVLWCFVKAYYENAFLSLDTSKWHYKIGRWDNAFLPLSRKCTNEQLFYLKNVSLPGANKGRARFELTLLPGDIGPSIVNTVDQPFAWWYGQFMKYVMRPNQNLKEYLASKKREIGFVHPIVGIHVRRTDKVRREAKYHDLEEYMYYVEDYYLRMELAGVKQERRVFVASDEPNVLKECKKRYQRYTCLGFPQNAALTSNFTSRDSTSSLWGILAELTLLAECEFLVCTFSSGLCRVAYELMHAVDPGASNRVHSLDVEFFYAWQRTPDRIVLYDHIPKHSAELELHRNDILRKKDEMAVGYEAKNGKRMDGLTAGVKSNSSKGGLYPIFKTVERYHFKTSHLVT